MSDVVLEDDNLVDYYRDLLIIQYADKPKARALMENLLGQLICYDLAVAVRDGFDINTAVGAQLDIIAKYVGVSRVITGTSFTREYFGFAEYGDTTPFDFNPFIKYGDPIPDVQFRNYKESSQSLYALNDEELRVIIKLAILRNNSNASVKDIDTLLNLLFGADVYYIDRMNMTVVSYMLGTAYARIFNIAKSSGLLPNPAAVGTSLIVVPDIDHVFSFSLYGGDKPTFAVGFSDYFSRWLKSNKYFSLTSNIKTPICSIDETKIIIADPVSGILQMYYFDGAIFVPYGDSLTIPIDSTAICYTGSMAVVSNSHTNAIQAYFFDPIELTWSALGAPYSISNNSNASMSVTGGPERIAFYDGITGTMQILLYSSGSWSTIGVDRSFSAGYSSAVSISGDYLAFYNDVDNKLYCLDSASGFATVGNALSLSIGKAAITLISTNKIAIADSSMVQTYYFDGADWTIMGSPLDIAVSDYISLSMGGIEGIYIYDPSSMELRLYTYLKDLAGCMASYS